MLGVVWIAGLIFLILPPNHRQLVSPVVAEARPVVNLWFPTNASTSSANLKIPRVSAQAAYFVDIDTGEELFVKNIHQRMEIASLTKIMTAIITLENRTLSDYIAVSEHASRMEPDHMELLSGERLTVEELLDGVFLVSANDAAESLAENVFLDRAQFIMEMNIKAEQLGMKDTLFINPTGLEEDGREQYSSAYDVMLMSRFLVKSFPKVPEITRQPEIDIPQTDSHQDYKLISGINLLTTYPGVLGLKTGYTPKAGLTLVTLADRGGHEVMGVILNSEDRRGEAKDLLDYSFKKLEVKIE